MPSGSFSDRLKQSMELAGIKQADLIRLAENQGKKLGKSQVSQYVSGKTIPRKDVLDVLALVLGVDRDWLLGGVGEQATAVRSQSVVAQGQETHVCANAAPDALSAESDLQKRSSDDIPSSLPSSDGIHLQEAVSRTIDRRSTVMGMREFKKSSKLDNVLYVSSFPNAKATPIRAACSLRARRSCSMPRSSISPTSAWTTSTRETVCRS